jgi:hypothetical protein
MVFLSHCSGLRALNKIGISSEENYSGEHVSFATVFTTYNSVSAGDDNVPSDSVTVGNSSYSKIERSMAILNTFISFIKVPLHFLLSLCGFCLLVASLTYS